MRLLIRIGVFLTLASGGYSQHRGGFAPGPIARPVPPMSIRPPAPCCGVSPPGVVRPPGAWWRHGGTPGFGFNRFGGAVLVPYVVPYPAYTDSGYFAEPPYAYQQQPPPGTPMEMPPQQSGPPVAINQYVPDAGQAPPPPDSPAVQTYQVPVSPRPAPPEPTPPTFFIALKDGWVYTTSVYWVDKGTLHYITAQGKHNQVSLDLVDRQTSAKLNEGRAEFRLPPPQ